MMNRQEDILNGIEIIRNGDQLTVQVPLRLTEAKLEVLVEIAKAFGQTPELVQDSLDQDIRCQLESSGTVGEALNKTLCDTWLQEIGEVPEEHNT
jgi:hypothetical protein